MWLGLEDIMRKLTYEEVKKYIETQGYKLLSNEYIKSILKLQMMCPNSHIFEMSFHNFKDNNHRCPYCYNEHRNESTKFTYNEVKEYLESFCYIVTIYEDSYMRYGYGNMSAKRVVVKIPEELPCD